MRHLSWIAAAALIFSTQAASLQAAQGCGPCAPMMGPCDLCDVDFCDVNYSIYGDFLWWKVNKGDLVISSVENNEERYLCPQHHAGWRVGGFARYDNWDFGLRYTAFCPSTSKSNEFFFPIVDLLRNTTFTHKFDYRVLDIELGYTCCACQPLSFRPFVGAKLAWVDDELVSSAIVDPEVPNPQELTITAKADFKGYGLYLGISNRWEFCNWQVCDMDIPIALVGRFTTGILDGRFDRNWEFEFGPTDEEIVTIDIASECLFVPYHEVFVGLDVTFCDLLCDVDVNLQIGYEAQYWGWREYGAFFLADRGDITHLGLGGLVVRLGLNF